MADLSPERWEELVEWARGQFPTSDGLRHPGMWAVQVAEYLAPLLAAEREAGAAEVRARVEAVIEERGYAYRDAPRATPIIRAFTDELRAALNGGE